MGCIGIIITEGEGGKMKYILKENLQPSVYGFTGDDYESEYGLLRGHLLDSMEEDLNHEIIYSSANTEASDETKSSL
jgi:hypothetical protein